WVYDTQLPPLPVLIWRNAALAVLAACATLALLAWRAGFRFGPRTARDLEARRQLMEHIDGVARFYQQHRSIDTLLEDLRGEIARAHEARGDGTNDLSASLAAQTGIAEDEIRWALDVRTNNREASFHRAVGILQRVRKAL
ncbi:MAG: hypothetical protein P8Y95_17235, partial [Gammaproteobacteria bacterium]